MKNTFISLSALAALVPFVLADQTAVRLVASAPGLHPLDQQPIEAVYSDFYIGQPTTGRIICYHGVEGICPRDVHTTVIVNEGICDLVTENLPGGQTTYVQDNGWWSYTAPEESRRQIPAGAEQKKFKYTAGPKASSPGSLTYSGFGAQNWLACELDSTPVIPKSWRVYANTTSFQPPISSQYPPLPNPRCTPISIAAIPVPTPDIYEYLS